MNEYQIAIIVSGCIAALWLCSYVLSWACQWAWAWVDDSKAESKNWLVERFTKREAIEIKWIYPVYNHVGSDMEEHIKNTKEPFGYAKDIKHENASCHGIDHGTDYLYVHEVDRLEKERVTEILTKVVGISICSPPILLVSFKLYPLALAIMTTLLIAHMARFGRRHKKLFEEHAKDKDAHN